MKLRNLSMKSISLLSVAVFLILSGFTAFLLYYPSQNILILIGCLLIVIFALLCGLLLNTLLNKKLNQFTSDICNSMDCMFHGEDITSMDNNKEMLLDKISHRLERLYSILKDTRLLVEEEKLILQTTIGDISHQIKTPISNLKLLNESLLEKTNLEENERAFLLLEQNQIEKLDFLIQSLIKTSRLESGLIILSKTNQRIYDTLANALGQISFFAEKKKIAITINCETGLSVAHDKKWTAEALYNILDNAVKYTQEDGSISIQVKQQEMYTIISITDTGKGISNLNLGNIFKRFYREADVHDTAGVGIGLYLTRDIISKQGGYIQVSSKISKGSTFSVFLPNF